MNQELNNDIEVRRDILHLTICLDAIMDALYESNGLAFNDERAMVDKIYTKSKQYLEQFK